MSQVDVKQGYVAVVKNWKNQIDCCSNLNRNESGKGITYQIQHEECQEQVFKEYKIGLTGFVEHAMIFELQNDEISMDVHSEIDVGQVVLNPNILLLEDVCFKADDVVEVDSYRVDCQICMAKYQNSDFHVFQILELLILEEECATNAYDQNLLFVDPISTQQIQRICADYKKLIYLILMDIQKFQTNLHVQKLQAELRNAFSGLCFTKEDNQILKIHDWINFIGSAEYQQCNGFVKYLQSSIFQRECQLMCINRWWM
ncbi:hypothetical protein GOP47_0017357 [Adiantum capillus-veneris]|uniref:Uncharacterized protein n=1 Tax=Adiantum capillus-veneris TaxID=13818 RepID=A0A9D4UF69_ADICA|nr:hypothetical protein GOP47_0017357 [Adiantum capillus-veneris]